MTVIETIRGVLMLVVIVCAYFVPASVARHRKVPDAGSVLVVNVLLGWTVVGWVVALAMACRDVPPNSPPRVVSSAPSRRSWPHIAPDGTRDEGRGDDAA